MLHRTGNRRKHTAKNLKVRGAQLDANGANDNASSKSATTGSIKVIICDEKGGKKGEGLYVYPLLLLLTFPLNRHPLNQYNSTLVLFFRVWMIRMIKV